MAQIRKALIRNGVQALLRLSAWLAREPGRRHWSERWSRWLARAAIARGRIGPTQDAQSLGAAWQRAFASPRQVPLTRVEADTVYAQIRTPCPLRGSGDTHACYRMMAFDREVAAAAGGRFIVLRSQAEPGVEVCEVALQTAGTGTHLEAAHERAPGGRA